MILLNNYQLCAVALSTNISMRAMKASITVAFIVHPKGKVPKTKVIWAG